MWRGIGAEEETRIAGDRGFPKRQPVALALGHREAIHMRSDPAAENCVAVDRQMMRGDRRPQPAVGCAHIIDRIGRGHVLQHHPEAWKFPPHGIEHALDIDRLAVEHVDRLVGDLAVDQERHADPLHLREHRADRRHAGHPHRRIGRCPGGVEFYRVEDAVLEPGPDIVRIGIVGHIGGHQRHERMAVRQGRPDARAVGLGLGRDADRRHQIGHHDGAAEHRGGEAHDRVQHRPVAEMKVPVVGPRDGDPVPAHGGSISAR